MRLAAVLSACLALMLVGGCSSDPSRGYSFGGTFDSSIDSIYVPVVKNDTFFRGLGTTTTDAVIKEIQRRTPWTVVQAETADATLTISIDDALLQPLTNSTTTGFNAEQALVATTSFTLTDNRSGRVITARRGFRAEGAFIQDGGAIGRVDVAERELAQRFAAELVNTLRSKW